MPESRISVAYTVLCYVHSVREDERLWVGGDKDEAMRMVASYRTRWPQYTTRLTVETYYDPAPTVVS